MGKIVSFFKRNKILTIIILGIYLFLMIIGLLNHEYWRDELQAWTIARDLSFIDIFKQMKWEGHPCLWHLILSVPAKLGLPVMSMGVVSVIFMFLSAILVMYKSPFHLPVKLLIIFSSPFLYFYSLQSRVYCIIPFLICLLAIVYPKRMEKPLLFATILAFLTNSHIMMSCFVGIVSLLFFKDIITNNKLKSLKHWCALGIIFIGIIILFLQVYESLFINSIVQDLDGNSYNPYLSFFQNVINKILYGVSYEINSYTGIDFLIYDNNIFNNLWFILIIFVLLTIASLIISVRSALVGFVSFMFIFLLHVFIWFSLPQRAVMLIIMLMFATWINYHDTKKKWTFIFWEIVLSLFCIISIPYGIESYNYDVQNPVSGAPATAEFIENNLSNAEFICPVDYVATSITGYIDEDIFYSNIRKDYFTFVYWDEYWRKEVSFEYFYDSMIEFKKAKDDNVYIIHSKYFMWNYDGYFEYLLKNGVIEEIYKSPDGLSSETYWVYKFVDNYQGDVY